MSSHERVLRKYEVKMLVRVISPSNTTCTHFMCHHTRVVEAEASLAPGWLYDLPLDLKACCPEEAKHKVLRLQLCLGRHGMYFVTVGMHGKGNTSLLRKKACVAGCGCLGEGTAGSSRLYTVCRFLMCT